MRPIESYTPDEIAEAIRFYRHPTQPEQLWIRHCEIELVEAMKAADMEAGRKVLARMVAESPSEIGAHMIISTWKRRFAREIPR